MVARMRESALVVSLLLAASVGAHADPFRPASTVEQNLIQHHRVPAADREVWWMATGEDMAWNNKHLSELLPTVPVYRAGQVRELRYALRPQIAGYLVDTPRGKMPFAQFLDSDQSTNMGIVIVAHGKIVFEHYGRMQAYEKPIWWSVSKVFASSLIALLEDRGRVDTAMPVDFYLPELSKTDFAGVTVRNVLDMASGVDCSDGHYDRGSCYYEYEASLGDAVRSGQSADTPYEFLQSLHRGRWAEQGTGFDYSGVNTFVLSWIVERVLGMPFQDAVTQEYWSKIGAEGDAAFLAARHGIALTSGGFMAKPRDMARFGLLFTPSRTVLTRERPVSERYLAILDHGGRPELLRHAREPGDSAALEQVKFNAYQWDRIFTNGDIYKGGWAGQGLLINPGRDVVAVYVGYAKDDRFSEVDVLPRLRQVLDGVYGRR
jgi:CubicO group peptidase (beta-lactamase class C family)